MDRKIDAFDKIIEYEKSLHEKNQKRIKIGIKLLLIIPIIFLIIMFWTESNKIIFLTLWIVSLFAIALYLIGTEYIDYELQMKLREFGIYDEDEEIKGLIKDRVDVNRIIRVANVIQDSLTLEDKSEPEVARLEDKSRNDEDENIERTPQRRPVRPSSDRPANPENNAKVRRPEENRTEKPKVREPRTEQPKRRPPNPENRQKATQGKKPGSNTETMKNMIDSIGVEAAEEELMASIKRYVAEVNKGDQPIVVEPRKTAEDYAKMRKKRAQERFENGEQ